MNFISSKRLSCALPVVLGTLLFATSASSTIIGGMVTGGQAFDQGGIFVNLSGTAPFTVGNDNFQDFNLYAFDEDQNIAIAGTIDVDVGIAPQVGDIVASHYIAYDSPTGSVRSQLGYVDFDAPIFGIATSTAFLNASDFLANSGVTYLSPNLRGLEAGDSVMVDINNPNRIIIDWSSASPGDYMRVFTMKSPIAEASAPATIFLIMGALGALFFIKRRQRV